MNVTFHTLVGLAVVRRLGHSRSALQKRRTCLPMAAIFLACIASHGVMDYLPHTYPIPSRYDVAISVVLFVAALSQAERGCGGLVVLCYAGSLLPDVVDLGPALLNRHVGLDLPLPPSRLFPWHWPQYSGSIYGDPLNARSLAVHAAVLGFCVLIAFRQRADRA